MAGAKKPQEAPNEVPGWIVSFSDMVTLLLAFFVLLQTFAKVQDDELFHAGRGSFQRAVSGMGLNTWFGGKMSQPLKDFRSLKYPTKGNVEEQGDERIIDLEDNNIRQAFKTLQASMDIKSTDAASEVIAVQNTPIMFAPQEAILNDAAKAYLDQLAADLLQTTDGSVAKIYVIGLAADVKTRKDRFILSALRGERVQRYLAAALAGGSAKAWDVYSWGAGDGGQLCKAYGLTPMGASGGTDCIAVAIMGSKSTRGR